MNLADALNTIALLLPGYFGAWAMSFMLGIRRREWQQTILYSLVYSALTYLLLFRASPSFIYWLKNFVGIDLTGFQHSLNQVSNLGDPQYKLILHDTVKVVGIASVISCIFGYLVGNFRQSQWFVKTVIQLTNRSQNVDIWTDFHQRYDIGPHTVELKNGDVYYGQITMVSDTLTGSDRGIILHKPYILQNPVKAAWESRTPGVANAKGHVLLFVDQIASIMNSEDPNIVRRTLRQRKIQRGNLKWNKRIRRIRKWFRSIAKLFG